MNILHGLLYPASYLRRDTMLRLDQVFSKLTLLVPTEEDINPPLTSSNCSMEIEATAPAPLGKRLDWFTDLISNWKSWAQEMGLGEKIPASTLIYAAKGEEESLQGILNTLRGTEVPDPLLDAQIFLQLSLDLDRRNDELQTDLDEMAIHEDKLKSILQDPVEQTDSQGSSKKSYSPIIKPLLMAEERLRAWALLWQKYTDSGPWPIGESITVKDLVDKAYETLQPREAPVDLLDLVLPLDPNIKPGESDKINNGLTSLIKAISNTTIQNMSENREIQELSEEIKEDWGKANKNQFPGPTMNLTLYPKRTWNEVFSKAADLELKQNGQSPTATIGWSFFLC
ncbi:MAG: hypothetical protein JRJ43_02855 [Deltaproteobacteria bacterium]|nr:hypothetical protein [Deltaproteobacteria bacterium]MBW1932181.1 hypothetical protein [Deltaproteobacteria bacterium]MBW1937843.1 hypothetical protein [Deltaproteobacteria bacterium]MBW1964068.1 hypothetical protein [Deltaproteobacteria bacterium]MBW2079648.1 hypothetical protein [Deltaproteobacteria bacterium]